MTRPRRSLMTRRRARPAGQLLIEGQLDAFLPWSSTLGEAHHVGHDLAFRIVAAASRAAGGCRERLAA